MKMKHLFLPLMLLLIACNPKVEPLNYLGILFPKSPLALYVGEEVQLDFTTDPLDYENLELLWTVDDPTVAAINPTTGLLKGLSAGPVTITLEDQISKLSDTLSLTVYEELPAFPREALVAAYGEVAGNAIPEPVTVITKYTHEYEVTSEKTTGTLILEGMNEAYSLVYQAMFVGGGFTVGDDGRYHLSEADFYVGLNYDVDTSILVMDLELIHEIDPVGTDNFDHPKVSVDFKTTTGLLSGYLGERSTFTAMNVENDKDFTFTGYRINNDNNSDTVLSDGKGIVLSSAKADGSVEHAYLEFGLAFVPELISFDMGTWLSGNGTSDTLTKVALQEKNDAEWVDILDVTSTLTNTITTVSFENLTGTHFRLFVTGTSTTNNGGRLVIDSLVVS
ncbi:MAG: Ig-like domain-containing protein [Erysipelotrichaceae bacterium]|jgi:hypothetical protein|nr:Ig-like domain-containing protein [Erysipelotrichaceae bacterium]